jgi:hypothetical protein
MGNPHFMEGRQQAAATIKKLQAGSSFGVGKIAG